eukprot:3014621-Rhodomonas_salina.1
MRARIHQLGVFVVQFVCKAGLVPSVGSFACECPPGFEGNVADSSDDGVTCSDVDECAAATDNCDTNAACSNTVGSFNCTCNSGWTSSDDGVTCWDVDECAAATDNCGAYAGTACNNTVGSFACECAPGFEGDGNINECATEGGSTCDAECAPTRLGASSVCVRRDTAV